MYIHRLGMVSDSSNKSVNMVKKTVKDVKKDMKDNKSDNKTDNKQNTKENTKILKKNTVSDFELSLMNRSLSENKKKEDANNLDVNDIFRVLDLHFYKDFYTYRHLHNSYNKFIDETIPDFLKNSEHVFTESVTEQRIIKHKFEFTNIRADTPKMSNDVDPLFPSDARKLMLSYQMSIYADVTQYREIVDINSTGKSKIKKEKIGHTEENMVVMTVPTMLRSKYCNLNVHAEDAIDECRYDPGGYFIINGSEKIVISQDKMIPNTPLVFMKKGSNASYHVVQVNSTSDDLSNMMQTVSIRLKKDGVMVMKFPILYEVNPMIVFRALGIETDADIAEICVYDKTDYHMLDLVRTSLDNCFNDNREGSRIKIRTREEAIDYLITKMKVVRKYTETSQSVKHEQKRLHLLQLLKSSLLPHITGTSEHPYKEKALYMGYMINKLLKVELGREEVHNRDSYNNKRVANINELLGEIMVQHYKSNISECNKKFMDWMKDKIATEEPHNVIHHFKASVFEQGFKTALMLGNWPRAKGVSQMLSRISYMQFISFLSRIDSQSTSKSSSKLTKPRQTDPSSVPFLCCVTGDTEILQSDDKTVKNIKDMKNEDKIKSVYKTNLSESSTYIRKFFSRMADDIIKIVTIDGRSLKCTKDHPILTYHNGNYNMVNAGDLKTGNLLIIRETEKDDELDIKKIEYEKYSDNFNEGEMGSKLKYDEFIQKYHIQSKNFMIPIKSITNMPDELVYDFTTVLDSHTFIANGFVVSNCVQTPEHAKIGMIKHLSLIGSITIGDKDNTAIVREYIMKHPDVKRITDVPIHELKNMFKVMLNGEWIGMIKNEYEVDQDFTDNPVLRLYSNAKAKKIKGEFDPQMTSVVLDTNGAEVRFNTDSGRLYRPVLRVVGDNELVLTKAMIERISLKSDNPGKISSWDDFYTIEEAPIEFLDSEEQPFAMVAPMIKDLNREREKILGSKNFKLGKEREDTIINRYSDKFFVRYDYCEIHPSVLLGEIATNIPFTNRNAGPRNIFQYAQGRQGMGIYCTTYRSRTDISYILYYPETPIVNSRTSKYTYTDVLGPGSNAIVAITTYGGHNQEDSLIFNKTSLERGIFRSMSLKKYVSQVTKNQETSANDKFMKPTPDKTLSMKNGNYEKLNLEGYLPEETKITNNDIIFGKVTPITDMPDSDKIYKDESEQFKEKSDGVIDRMYIGINNQEGHEVRKALVRMERMPMVGDKFCYTEDHEVLTTTGWVSIKDITKEHYVATLVNGTTLKYQKPKAVQVLDHDGDMYVVDSNQVSLKVTPNHRMYVADRSGKKFKIELAQDIKGKRRKYLKNVEKVDVSNLQKPRELKFDSNGNVTKFLVYGSKKDVDKSKDVFNQMVVKDIKSFVGKYKEDIETSLKIVQDEIKAFNLEVETYRKKHGDIDNDFTARMKIRKEILDIKLKWYTDSDIEFPKLKEVKNTKIKVVKKKHIEIKENNKVLPMKISLSNSGVELIANTNTNANTNVDKGVDIKPIKIAKGVTKQVKADQKSEDLDEDMAKDEECVLHEFDINAWLEFFGIWLAEGSLAGNRVIAFAAHKQRVKDRLVPLCKTLGLKLTYVKDRKSAPYYDIYRVCKKSVAKIFSQFGTAIYKCIPDWAWFLNKEQARILINGMMLGDGHQMKGTTTRRYDTSSTRLRDDFQRLCLHAGYAANYALKYEAGHKSVVKTRNGKALTKKETITSTVDAFRLAVIETQTMPIVNKNIKADGTGGNDRYEKFKGKVYCCTVPNDGVIYVRRNGLGVWSGNCSRHGQKGTVGIGLKASDMPHTKNGIRPDIIMNPNAIPSRMTIGQFWEQLLGKVGALMGINVDSTSFEDYDINEVREMLRKLGYNDVGEEYLYNGMTGMRMKTSIFIAPAFYQRLKHMVYDKMHARARGSTTILVRQAAEGRTREGGLRLGEMERDALIAHGMSKFLNEKMMYTADVYSTYVCGICGLFAIREVTRNSENKPMPGDIYKCPTCKNYHDIHKIMIPYAFKLMIQELMAMNILARIRVKKSERKIIREIGEIE